MGYEQIGIWLGKRAAVVEAGVSRLVDRKQRVRYVTNLGSKAKGDSQRAAIKHRTEVSRELIRYIEQNHR